MKRVLMVLMAFWIACSPTAAVAAAETAIPIINSDLINPPAVEETRPTGRLRIIERRQLGLTVKNVIRVLQEMKAEGQLAQYATVGGDGAKEIDATNLAAEIANRLASERPSDWSDIDWDQIIEFIEKILELLIKFLPIIFDLFM